METQSISVDQQRRVQEVQNLLATGIEQLILFYFDMQLHGLMVPGSLDIVCYVCDEFDIKGELMNWDDVRWGDRSREEDIVATLYCMRCEFAFPWPCGNLKSERLMETMRFIAGGGMTS